MVAYFYINQFVVCRVVCVAALNELFHLCHRHLLWLQFKLTNGSGKNPDPIKLKLVFGEDLVKQPLSQLL